ncbi:17390_t:CDS:2, partial [Acaulospora morrowiae]
DYEMIKNNHYHSSSLTSQERTHTSQENTVKIRSHDKRSINYIIRSFIAGGAAGCVAKSVIAPFDRVKILFQASNPHFQKYAGRIRQLEFNFKPFLIGSWTGVFQATRRIYMDDGPKGLFQGHSATLIRIFPYAAIKFVAYEQFRHILIPSRKYETSMRILLSGSLAGVTSVLFTYPLELIRVRLAYEVRGDNRIGFKSICRQVYHESAASHRRYFHFPLMNFYRGLLPTIMGMIPYAGVSFWTHYILSEFSRKMWPEHTTRPSLVAGKLDSQGQERRAPLKTWVELGVGGVAGAVSQTAAYPFEVIRRRMQVHGAFDPSNFVGIWQTTKTIWNASGFKGFFVGLSIGYLKVTPMVAVSFTVYNRMKLLLNID